MFNVPLKKIEREFNVPYRTLQNFKNRKDYRKKVVEVFGDMIVLEELAKKDLEVFTEAEIAYIKDAIDKYLTEKSLKKEDINKALITIIKDNSFLKEIVEKKILNDFSNPQPLLYKLDKLDKLSRYFLLRLFNKITNKLSVKPELLWPEYRIAKYLEVIPQY